ncbi:MAG: hypothetical protein HYY24_06005 [Verrucomicrobia bacterium]|nr:hypothetical protein [Verrucomicrobiota bacterium]
MARTLAERLRADGLKVWFAEWVLPVAASRQSAAFSSERQTREAEDGGALPRRRYAQKIEAGLEHLRVLACPAEASARRRMLSTSANPFGSDWAQLACPAVAPVRRRKAGTFRFRDPPNKERRFVSLRLDDAPIKGFPTAPCFGRSLLAWGLSSSYCHLEN